MTRSGMPAGGGGRGGGGRAGRPNQLWAATDYDQRAAVIRKAALLLEQHAEEIAPWIVRETGAIRGKAGFELHSAGLILWGAAGDADGASGGDPASRPGVTSLARRVPHGVVGVISPFNFPLILACARRTGARGRQRRGAQARPAHADLRRLPDGAGVRGGRAAPRLPAGAARRRAAGEALVTDPNVP